jgi:Transposase DDE domain
MLHKSKIFHESRPVENAVVFPCKNQEQNGRRYAPLEMEIFAQSYSSQAAGRMRPCKFFLPNRTKVFHVKHFCPIKGRNRSNSQPLTEDFISQRRVSRLENEAVLDQMAARLKARPDILARRREIVEHPFGGIKQWMNQGAFLMRGVDNVRAEFSLAALVYNPRRALNILGVETMMAAVRG